MPDLEREAPGIQVRSDLSLTLRVALSAAFFWLAMAGYYILKPLREAYFLHSQGIEQVAKVHVVVMLVTFVAVHAYAWLARRVGGRALAVWAYASFVLTVVGFWAAVRAGFQQTHVDAFVWSFYIWVSLFSAFAVALFWSVAHDIFTPEEGSKHYGLIGAAGILGGFIGGLVTSRLVERIGLGNLFLVAAALLIPCVAIASFLGARAPAVGTAKSRPASEISAWELFRGSRYLSVIFLFVFLYQAVSIMVDQQTKLIVKQHLKTPETLAKFQADIYVATNIIGTLVNLFVTGWVQSRFGPFPGLVVLPLCALVGAVGFAVAPSIQVAAVVTTLGLAASYSIQQSSKEILYIPVPSAERYVAKAFIDTFAFRMGNGMTSFWLWLAVPAVGGANICGAIAAAALGMIGCATWLAPRHKDMVETSAPARP